jgi:F-box-like
VPSSSLYASTFLLTVPTLLLSSDVQTSAVFSDVFARVESGFHHFRTVTHDHNARLAAISTVDKEVDAARQLLCSLLTRRNALAPISLLPPEILARVFHVLALQEPPYSDKQNYGWIRTTHVCRHWRQVALGDSSLWARISDMWTTLNTASISEMLARARNAPLEIGLVKAPSPDVLLMFPPHLSHTRALRLSRLSELHFDNLRDIFSREAPALEHLALELSVTSPITFQDLGVTTLFKGQAPKLRTFCISHLCIPWSFIPRGQLTQLTITLLDEMHTADAPSLGDARQFIDLLVNCPALEILVLEFCLPCDLSQSSRGQTVHLPRLSSLRVRGSSSRVTNLLKMLRLPSAKTLHLRCFSEIGSPHNDYHILPVLSAQFQTSAHDELKALGVTLSDRMLEFAAISSLTPSMAQLSRDIEVDVDGDPEFVLSFDRLHDFDHRKGILERACKILPIPNLEFLSIATHGTVGSVNWAELFKRCTNVSTIQAIGRGTGGFIRDLTPPNTKKGKKKKRNDSGASAIPAPGPIIFPNLTSLIFQDLDFTEIKSHSGVLYDVLANGLRQRNSTYNLPIMYIRVDHCVIPVKRANALKRLVPEFHWDGEEGLINAFDESEDFGDYDSDFIEPGARWEDFFVGSTQAEWEWWENYSDGW